MKKLFVIGAFVIAIGSAFASSSQNHFKPLINGWYNASGQTFQGPVDQSSCPGGSRQCTITDGNGVKHNAYDSQTDAAANGNQGLLKFS